MVHIEWVLNPDPDKVEKDCPFGVKGFDIEAFKKFPAVKIRGGKKKEARVSKTPICVGVITGIAEVPLDKLNTSVKIRSGMYVPSQEIIPLSDPEQEKLKYAFRIDVNILVATAEGGDYRAKAILIHFTDGKSTIVEEPNSAVSRSPGTLRVYRALQDFAFQKIMEYLLAQEAKIKADAEVCSPS